MGLPRGSEWIIILIIIVLLFGPGRIGKLSGEIGKSIKAFRDGLSGEDKKDDQPKDANGNIEPK
jgi:sec-independent protein translocase protein TatA